MNLMNQKAIQSKLVLLKKSVALEFVAQMLHKNILGHKKSVSLLL